MRFKLAALVLLTVAGLHAQGPQTVFAQLVSNSASPDITVSIDPKYNLGQPYHLLTAILSDAPGQTCAVVQPNPGLAGPFLDMLGRTVSSVEFSVITNYSRVISPGSTSPTNRYRMLTSAAGAFPLLGMHFADYDTTKCRASIFYSGSLTAVDIKKYTTFGTLVDELVTAPIDITTAGDHILVSAVPNAKISVYAIVLFNTTGPQSLTFTDHRIDASTTTLMFLNSFCTGCLIQLPNTNFPLFTTSLGGSLVLNMSAATPVSGLIMFRNE